MNTKSKRIETQIRKDNLALVALISAIRLPTNNSYIFNEFLDTNIMRAEKS